MTPTEPNLKLPALLVELLAGPLMNRPLGVRWLSLPDLVGDQIDQALRVRRGLRCMVSPIAVGAEAHASALDDAANFGGLIEQLTADYAGRPLMSIAYAHPGDPQGRHGALREARMVQAIIGGQIVLDQSVPCYGVILPGETEPEVVFVYAADPAQPQGSLQ